MSPAEIVGFLLRYLDRNAVRLSNGRSGDWCAV